MDSYAEKSGVMVHLTMQDRITEGLREEILAGRLRPGDRLRQDEIARQFSVSHIPVREALRQLNAEGFIEIQPHRGAIVSGLSLRELDEIIRLRQILEVDLVTQAAVKFTESDAAVSQKLLSAVRANRSASSYAARNWDFHESLYRPADAPLALGLVKRLHLIGERYFQLEHDLSPVNDEHQAILDLVKAGNARAAGKLLRDHIGRLTERVAVAPPKAANSRRRSRGTNDRR
jgi:DNA-binding GntR family transcriptional regulator